MSTSFILSSQFQSINLNSDKIQMHLPKELLTSCIVMSGDPIKTKKVSHYFRECSLDANEIIVKSFMEDRRLSAIVAPLLPVGNVLLTSVQFEQIAEQVRKQVLVRANALHFPIVDPREIQLQELFALVQREEDANFLEFFNQVLDELPVEQTPVFADASDEEGSRLRRNWMRAHPAILNQVTELDLSDLQITALPQEISLLPSLETLDISHNNLHSLPQQIGELAHLHVLNLSDNKLKRVPLELCGLAHLQSLNLSKNRIASVPKQIKWLSRLVELDLSKNRIRSSEEELIAQLNTLPNRNITIRTEKFVLTRGE
jgi:hypothetical protein